MPINEKIYAAIIYNDTTDTPEYIEVYDSKLTAITDVVVEMYKHNEENEHFDVYIGYVIDENSECHAEVLIEDDSISIVYENLYIPEGVFHRIVCFVKETLDKRLSILREEISKYLCA